MKKKVFISLLLVILIAASVICVFLFYKDKGNDNKNEEEETETIVDDQTVKLDLTKSLKDISFNYPSEGKVLSGNDYFIVDYKIDKKIAFRTGIYYYENKTIDEVMSEKKAESKENKTINNIEWRIYGVTSLTSGRELLYYNYQKDNVVYSILFSFENNDVEYIKTFMNLVKFN